MQKFLIFLTLLSQLVHGESLEGSKPSIIFIMVDDMGFADISSNDGLYPTPNIDQLAKKGMRFTNAYAACTVCSPTRASFLNGLYPARSNITDWIPGHKRPNEKLSVPQWQKALPEDSITFPQLLKEKGYATASFGKWHLGKLPPTSFGFDIGGKGWKPNKEFNEEDPKGVFSLTRKTLEFLDANKDKPAFVYLSHYAVHGPNIYNKKVRDTIRKKYKAEGTDLKADYAAMIQALDDSVGLLLKELEKRKRLKNTLIVFYSDNGGKVPTTRNTPFRDGKGSLYEGGHRVPLIVHWPDKVAAGATSDQTVTTMDFFPTFCSLAGVDKLPTHLDGVNLLGLLTQNDLLDRDTLYWHYPHYHKGNPGGVIRKGKYKLIEWFEDNSLELYDLENDKGEKNNLVEQMPEKAKELLTSLKKWRSDVGAQMMEKNPQYNLDK